jgi:hypothetical protein
VKKTLLAVFSLALLITVLSATSSIIAVDAAGQRERPPIAVSTSLPTQHNTTDIPATPSYSPPTPAAVNPADQDDDYSSEHGIVYIGLFLATCYLLTY